MAPCREIVSADEPHGVECRKTRYKFWVVWLATISQFDAARTYHGLVKAWWASSYEAPRTFPDYRPGHGCEEVQQIDKPSELHSESRIGK